MSNVVMLGTNFFQVPLAKKLKKRGHDIYMFGYPSNFVSKELDLAAVQYAKKHYTISVLDTAKILKECEKIKPVAVVSMASDLTVYPLAFLSEKLGFPTNSLHSALISTNKYEMKKAFTEKKVPTAKFVYTDKVVDLPFDFPVVVKAIDSAGKRGITKVNSKKDLAKAIKYGIEQSTKADKVLIEEYVGGKEYSAEAFSWAGEHHVMTYTEKFSGPPHFVEEMHLQPAQLDVYTKRKIDVAVKKALEALEIKIGPTHTEFKIVDGEVKIIEVAARVVADAIWEVMKITTGNDWIDMYLDVAFGKEPDLRSVRNFAGYFGFVKFMVDEDDFKTLLWLQQQRPLSIVNTSDTIVPFDGREVTSNGQRYGHFVCRCANREEALELSRIKNV